MQSMSHLILLLCSQWELTFKSGQNLAMAPIYMKAFEL